MILSPAQIYQYAINAGFTGQSAQVATAIALAESSGDPGAIAYNDGGKGYNSYGLMQINAVNNGNGITAENAVDPQTSMNYAYQLSNGGQNFSPWSTYNNGAYQNYMSQVSGGTDGTGTVPTSSQGDGGLTYTWPADGSATGTNDPSSTDSGNQDFGGGQDFTGGFGATSTGTTGPAASGSSGDTPAQASSWWNTVIGDVYDFMSRFGLIILAIVFLGIAAYFFVKKEAAPKIVEQVKDAARGE